jgi:hypothetical protein
MTLDPEAKAELLKLCAELKSILKKLDKAADKCEASLKTMPTPFDAFHVQTQYRKI